MLTGESCCRGGVGGQMMTVIIVKAARALAQPLAQRRRLMGVFSYLFLSHKY